MLHLFDMACQISACTVGRVVGGHTEGHRGDPQRLSRQRVSFCRHGHQACGERGGGNTYTFGSLRSWARWPILCLMIRRAKNTPRARSAAVPALVSVVDDDESIHESLPDLLRELGFAAQAFASAEEFLKSDYDSST